MGTAGLTDWLTACLYFRYRRVVRSGSRAVKVFNKRKREPLNRPSIALRGLASDKYFNSLKSLYGGYCKLYMYTDYYGLYRANEEQRLGSSGPQVPLRDVFLNFLSYLLCTRD